MLSDVLGDAFLAKWTLVSHDDRLWEVLQAQVLVNIVTLGATNLLLGDLDCLFRSLLWLLGLLVLLRLVLLLLLWVWEATSHHHLHGVKALLTLVLVVAALTGHFHLHQLLVECLDKLSLVSALSSGALGTVI